MKVDSSAFVSLAFCGSELRISAAAFGAIARRENVDAFLSTRAPFRFAECFELLVGRLRGNSPDWTAFESSSGAAGSYRSIPRGIEASDDTNALGFSLALRGLFSLALERQGGVLVHASCVSWDGRAALITGVSGAGKSTLARWAVRAGATLLSDEVVGVLPDGSVIGTPFRSDPDLLGTPTTARLYVVTTPRHGAHEAFEPLPSYRALQLLLEQTFDRDGAITARQALSCLRPAIETARTGAFSCRNAPEAGHSLRELVSENEER